MVDAAAWWMLRHGGRVNRGIGDAHANTYTETYAQRLDFDDGGRF
jgi:hypothetical protein